MSAPHIRLNDVSARSWGMVEARAAVSVVSALASPLGAGESRAMLCSVDTLARACSRECTVADRMRICMASDCTQQVQLGELIRGALRSYE